MGRELTVATGDKESYYHWELEFDLASRVVNQLNEAAKPKDERVNPQRPPAELGRPTLIRIVPHRDYLEEVSMAIPTGASPVCFCLRAAGISTEGASVNGIVAFAVGYRIDDVRTMKVVEPTTGKVIDTKDRVPAREDL
jgi:hypothetical protein